MPTTLTLQQSAALNSTRFVPLATLRAELFSATSLIENNHRALVMAKSRLSVANKMLAGSRKDAALRAATEQMALLGRALLASEARLERAQGNMPPSMRASVA
jgi:hypothetical protein